MKPMALFSSNMRIKNLWIGTGMLVVMAIMACNTAPSLPADEAGTGLKDSSLVMAEADSASCEKPAATRYPNNDKPMALMMRQMADNAQQMKTLIEKGEAVTGAQFPYIRFHLVEPTDPDVLQPQFYENARLFQVAHKELVNGKAGEQKALYQAYIAKCITCHETYCSGPLKRIRKLVID